MDLDRLCRSRSSQVLREGDKWLIILRVSDRWFVVTRDDVMGNCYYCNLRTFGRVVWPLTAVNLRQVEAVEVCCPTCFGVAEALPVGTPLDEIRQAILKQVAGHRFKALYGVTLEYNQLRQAREVEHAELRDRLPGVVTTAAASASRSVLQVVEPGAAERPTSSAFDSGADSRSDPVAAAWAQMADGGAVLAALAELGVGSGRPNESD